MKYHILTICLFLAICIQPAEADTFTPYIELQGGAVAGDVPCKNDRCNIRGNVEAGAMFDNHPNFGIYIRHSSFIDVGQDDGLNEVGVTVRWEFD